MPILPATVAYGGFSHATIKKDGCQGIYLNGRVAIFRQNQYLGDEISWYPLSLRIQVHKGRQETIYQGLY